MPTRVERQTVDLSKYPDLVVIYLGMRVNRIYGIKTLLGFGPKISSSVQAQPDGLLRHENFIFSLFPMHVGMRQYWRDHRFADEVDAFRSPPAMVAAVPEGFGRHGILARNLPPARRNGGYLRRYRSADWIHELRAGGCGREARCSALPPERKEDIRRTLWSRKLSCTAIQEIKTPRK